MADYEAPVTTLEAAEANQALLEPVIPLAEAKVGTLALSLQTRDGSIWVVLRRDDNGSDGGGIALRMPAFNTSGQWRAVAEAGAIAALEWSGELGAARLVVKAAPSGMEQIRATYEFTPSCDLSIGELPRDIVPFGKDSSPLSAAIDIEASQRKMNTGLLYFSLSQPDLGKVLYIQNFTALNDYFNATGTKPEEAVKAELPELGYRPPVDPETGRAILPAGKRLILYDTILSIRAYAQRSEADSAWQFLDMLGDAYAWLVPHDPDFRDWVGRARATVHDLINAPEARVEHYGRTYFHPYTASEYPDAMVQLSIASALYDWGQWTGAAHPLLREIMAGLDKFYDPELKTLRRYLPNVGNDKDPDAVDSWYLYHPMLNLANLALGEVEGARDLFLSSVDYGIRAAHHFNYKWPIMYKIGDFSIIREVAEADQLGQTDVGGIYAWVMLQAFELTHERRFLEEAVAAINAARGMRFDLNYQANLTAWGAAACIRLWRITNQKEFLTQSYAYLASFFHNSQLWESKIGLARHSRNFLGVTCLQDAPYMAAYECFDSFAAFERYLDYGGPDLIPGARLLVGEYCRHALDRAWFYYPDALPEEAVASDIRNGYIMRGLNFPLEDLYPDGQKAGQVGQEIYGSGAAMTYATRAFHRFDGVPFLIYCDTFIRAVQKIGPGAIGFRVDGPANHDVRIAIVGDEECDAGLFCRSGEEIVLSQNGDRREGWTPTGAELLLRWKAD